MLWKKKEVREKRCYSYYSLQDFGQEKERLAPNTPSAFHCYSPRELTPPLGLCLHLLLHPIPSHPKSTNTQARPTSPFLIYIPSHLAPHSSPPAPSLLHSSHLLHLPPPRSQNSTIPIPTSIPQPIPTLLYSTPPSNPSNNTINPPSITSKKGHDPLSSYSLIFALYERVC